MTATLSLFVLQSVTPEVTAALQRIAYTQTIVAIAISIITVLLIGACALGYVTLKRMNVVLHAAEKAVESFKPRVEPIMDALNVMSRDAAALVGAVRGRVDALMRTVDELHAEVRDTAAEARMRVKQFGAVLDIVQEEAEGLLLDAAATARGVHTTAERLRDPDSLAPPTRPVPLPPVLPVPPETDSDSERLEDTTVVMPLEP